MATLREVLKRHAVILADADDVKAIARMRSRDVITRISRILKAADRPSSGVLFCGAVAAGNAEPPAEPLDRVLVAFGIEIFQRIDGRISTEVNACPSRSGEALRMDERPARTH
jgi:transaldolase